MSNNLSKVRKKISRGELVLGTSVSLADPKVSEILCKCSFDIIWIEAEHSPLDKKDIDLHIMTVRKSGLAPFVRIAWNDPVIVKPILDMGPAAVIFPFIKTAEETKLAVESCRYPPKGIRGFGPWRANEYSTIDDKEYLKLSEREPWVVIQVEHIDAVNNLKEILKVDGVDSILVGPNDLSGSVGLLGQTRNPEVIKLLDKIANDCNEAGVPFGASIGFNKDNFSDWVNRGTNWIVLDDDFTFLLEGGISCYKEAMEISDKLNK